MDLRNKKILVTGADGFIGSHLTEELVRRGYNIRAFVFYNSFNSWGWLDHSPEEIKSDFEEKLPWEIKDIERQLEPTDRFRIHRMSVLGKEPYRGMKQVEHDPHGLLITVPSPRGAFYNPTYSENERVNDLAEMEALAEWLIENNQATKTKVAVS